MAEQAAESAFTVMFDVQFEITTHCANRFIPHRGIPESKNFFMKHGFC
jgi:hypothetical protein